MEITTWPDHWPIEYKDFTICKVCDTILCPANADSKCNDKTPRGAKQYIDNIKIIEKVDDLEDLLRSFISVCKRKGTQTNWESLEKHCRKFLSS